MSYGNFYIWEDLQKGVSKKEVAKRLRIRYDDINASEAMAIINEVSVKGPHAPIESWKYVNQRAHKNVKVKSYKRVKK